MKKINLGFSISHLLIGLCLILFCSNVFADTSNALKYILNALTASNNAPLNGNVQITVITATNNNNNNSNPLNIPNFSGNNNLGNTNYQGMLNVGNSGTASNLNNSTSIFIAQSYQPNNTGNSSGSNNNNILGMIGNLLGQGNGFGNGNNGNGLNLNSIMGIINSFIQMIQNVISSVINLVTQVLQMFTGNNLLGNTNNPATLGGQNSALNNTNNGTGAAGNAGSTGAAGEPGSPGQPNYTNNPVSPNAITPNRVAIDTDGTNPPPFNDPNYQSQTSLAGLDANKDYYVVVPIGSNIPLGSRVTLTNHTTGRQIQAIVGDRGPTANGYGEMSLAAARDLGAWQPGMGNYASQHSISWDFQNNVA